MKIYYAIINCKDNKLQFDNVEGLTTLGIDKNDIGVYTYDGDKTLSTIKNTAITYARCNQYQYVFLIENDIIIKDKIIFQKYIDLMLKYQLGVVYYGYYGNINRVLDNLPNPSIRVRYKDKDKYLVRTPNDVFIGIDLMINTHMFNETFKMMSFNEYVKRCFDFKVLPFQGFYFEVDESWKYFDYVDGVPTVKKNITKDNMEADKKYVADNSPNFTLVLGSDASQILKYLKSIGE